MIDRMKSSLSNFSKGSVIPKYNIVQMTWPIKYTSKLVFIFELLWFSGWMFLVIRFDNWWFGLPTLLPVLFRGRMYRMFNRWKVVGQITMHDDRITVSMNGTSTDIPLRGQKMIKLWKVITDRTEGSAHLPQFAMIVGVQFDRNEEFLLLNEMHLTAQDKLQFIEPPPSFGTLMFQACRNHGITVLNKRGEPWSDWLEAR
jgi:hypothetical protein